MQQNIYQLVFSCKMGFAKPSYQIVAFNYNDLRI